LTDSKRCFLSSERTCDLTCKAAFEVDDPVDNVDCHFVWLAYHFGEGMFNVSQMLQSGGPGGFGGQPAPGQSGPGKSGPGKPPSGSPSDN
jgi:hypothetical protein